MSDPHSCSRRKQQGEMPGFRLLSANSPRPELRRVRRAAILAEREAVAAPSNRMVFDDDDPAVLELHAEVTTRTRPLWRYFTF
jgi:hypothetical protein